MISKDQYSNAEEKKDFCDFLENIMYYKNELDEINNIPYCKEIKQYVENYIARFKRSYTLKQQMCSDVARYYNLSSFYQFEYIIPRIICASDGSSETS
ncbi:hypothetical protein POVWA2_002640 [Plasmodium ovale wallikeri]|uniref:PIR Superfamily Protein n=1 Tax=Plasmodium ovale wallikeri TaxID=864142 RepID=A0A1A8YHY7_PLAOA|nr:hypothetical protein POVWA2_002640 [Plasmodium ovale wallikeri]SBT57195.1 hypothetical protein POVWA1_080650 [Plasmodium ovale wallikeri]